MAFSMSKRAACSCFQWAKLASTSSRTTLRARHYASAATVPTSSSSHLPNQAGIRHESSVPNPDPSADSPTAAFLKQTAPYMVPTYVRPLPMFVKGDGCVLYDNENRAYLDFTAGIAVNSLGHADPEICRIIAHQAQQLIHASNLYHNPWTPTLSKLLVEETKKQSPGSHLNQVFISNSGSEANEAAIKFARKVTYAKDPTTKQRDIVSFHGSFHGRTYGSLSATPNKKYQPPFGPMLPGFHYGTFNDVEGVQDLITENTAGVIVEPIQGEGGINVATPEFLQALRKRCDEVGAVLIFDEIQCGLSRTGDLWAHTASGVQPDILTSAKALGNGIPIGATLVSGKTVGPYIQTGDHGTTFGGNPFACRVAHHVFERLAKRKLQEEVRVKSTLFFSAFETMKQKFPGVVTEVRGKGLIVGYQLSDSAKGKASEVITAARERGLLVITAGDGVLRVVPPLVISHEEINRGLAILEEAMDVVYNKPAEVDGTQGQQEMSGR
ncbi:Acetylornithine aminotransferase, mitochondrial [Exophiala dermatitidis]